MPEDLAYKEFVEDAFFRSFDKESGVIFATLTPEQAKVAMDAIIENAQENLRLMAKALSRNVHDPYRIVKALEHSKDLKIEVIVEMADPFNCKYSALSDLKLDRQASERIVVRQLPQPSRVHLSIGDTSSTRIREENIPTTIIAFNNREIAAYAADRFRSLWPQCRALPWPRPSKLAQPMPS